MDLKTARKLFKWQKVRKPCWRCNGTGIFKPYGNCFRCHGGGFRGQMRVRVFVDGVSDEDKAKAIDLDEARLERNRERAAERREAKRQANLEAVCAEIGVPVQWLERFENDFVYEMSLVAQKHGKLTTNQAAAVLKIYREQMRSKQVDAIKVERARMLDGIDQLDRETLEDYARGLIDMRAREAKYAADMLADPSNCTEGGVQTTITEFLYGASAPISIGREMRRESEREAREAAEAAESKRQEPIRVAATFIDYAPENENGLRIEIGCPCCGNERNVALNGWDAVVCGACDAVLEAVEPGKTQSFIQHLRKTENQSTWSEPTGERYMLRIDSYGEGYDNTVFGLSLDGALLLQKDRIRGGAKRATIFDAKLNTVAALSRFGGAK